ncbi:MAG: YraN family protein [Sporichthyaceae bacterium]
MRAKDELGRFGEDLAARYLSGAGLAVLERNWRCRAGEIDIVATEGRALVVCEVKTRRDDAFGGPLLAVTPVKLARLRRLAAQWLDERGTHLLTRTPGEIRIDVVGVWAGGADEVRVEHLRGV